MPEALEAHLARGGGDGAGEEGAGGRDAPAAARRALGAQLERAAAGGAGERQPPAPGRGLAQAEPPVGQGEAEAELAGGGAARVAAAAGERGPALAGGGGPAPGGGFASPLAPRREPPPPGSQPPAGLGALLPPSPAAANRARQRGARTPGPLSPGPPQSRRRLESGQPAGFGAQQMLELFTAMNSQPQFLAMVAGLAAQSAARYEGPAAGLAWPAGAPWGHQSSGEGGGAMDPAGTRRQVAGSLWQPHQQQQLPPGATHYIGDVPVAMSGDRPRMRLQLLRKLPPDMRLDPQSLADYTSPGQVTLRDVARIAGRIMAMSPAVATAPLHARVVGRAAAGGASWDEAVGDAQLFASRAELFMDLLRRKNGKTWWRRQRLLWLRVAGDASDRGYGALLPDLELGQGSASRMRIPFNEAEMRLMATQPMSSTERELRTVLMAVRWVQAHQPALLEHGQLQYQTDSQAAMLCVLGMKGGGECLRHVDELYRLCAGLDLEVQMVWFPRTAPLQQEADALSKYEDSSQWKLDQEVYLSLWAEPCLGGAGPVVDVFADENTTKLPGRFFSRHWSPGALAVDAFQQDWGLWSREGVLYINPPFGEMGQVVRKIAEERANCVLIALVWPRWWRVLLGRLPIRARRRLPHKAVTP